MELGLQQLNSLAGLVDDLLLDTSRKAELIKWFNFHFDNEFTFTDDGCKGYFYYILANCSSEIYKYQDEHWFSKNLITTVNLYEKSLYILKKTNDNHGLLSFVLTNFGNFLSSIGRSFCAQYYWDQAIKMDNNPVALVAKAQGVIFRSSQLYDQSHVNIHYYFANQLIKQAYMSFDALEEEQKIPLKETGDLYHFTCWYQEHFQDTDFDYVKEYKQKTKTKAELRYLVWSAENKLFLNDLNDLFEDEIVLQDILGLPDMTYKINSSLSLKESLVYHSNFDELRNEYTYARFLIFQASEIKTDTQHFYNKTYPHVYDTLHAIDNLKTSQMKSAFRILYSIFDKISYFLAKYLDLEMNDRQITFSKVFGWNENRKFKPRDKLKDSKNYFLHALFYILKEIESDQLNGHDKVSELNSREKIEKPRLSKIRNCLEHRSFRVIDDFGYELNTKFDMTSEFAYQNLKDQQNILIKQGEVETFEYLEILEKIKEKEKKANYILEIPLSEFENSLMDLVRLVRNSLMYLSFAVQFEEKMKPQPEGLILQREIPLK